MLVGSRGLEPLGPTPCFLLMGMCFTDTPQEDFPNCYPNVSRKSSFPLRVLAWILTKFLLIKSQTLQQSKLRRQTLLLFSGKDAILISWKRVAFTPHIFDLHVFKNFFYLWVESPSVPPVGIEPTCFCASNRR